MARGRECEGVPAGSTSRQGTQAPLGHAPVRRVRWDRLGRVAMLGVMVALVYLYLSAGRHAVLSTWGEAKRDSAQVQTLERQNTPARRRSTTTLSEPTATVLA